MDKVGLSLKEKRLNCLKTFRVKIKHALWAMKAQKTIFSGYRTLLGRDNLLGLK